MAIWSGKDNFFAADVYENNNVWKYIITELVHRYQDCTRKTNLFEQALIKTSLRKMPRWLHNKQHHRKALTWTATLKAFIRWLKT